MASPGLRPNPSIERTCLLQAAHVKRGVMNNSEARASRWVRFLAARSEFPAGARFVAAFEAGRITHLCDCGCNSFEIAVPADSSVEPLAIPGPPGSVFELEFRTCEETGSLQFSVLVGEDGHFSGLDVEYCGNALPVPEEVRLVEPPYHYRVSSALTPNPSIERTRPGKPGRASHVKR